MTSTPKITPCLWFKSEAHEAAQLYTSVFPNSQISNVHRSAVDTPGTTAGSVLFVEFTIAGIPCQALNGRPYDAINDAISLSVRCDDQAEVDRLWSGLTADGGRPVKCGWLKDKYGLSWQIVPKRMGELLSTGDGEARKRTMQAMMQMVKLDIAELERAHRG